MVLEIEGDDRAQVERQVLAALWGPETVRLLATLVKGRYFVSLHSAGEEPAVEPTADATAF